VGFCCSEEGDFVGEEETQQGKFPIKVPDILDRTITHLLEGFTGIASSRREDLVRSVGFVLQGLTAGRFLDTFRKEWQDYREKGRIKDDYESTEQCRSCLQELLDFLDKDLPDEQRFNVLKQIFLVAATEEASDRNSYLPLQYMQISRALTAGEVLVLNTAYRIAIKQPNRMSNDMVVAHWQKVIAKESGLTYPELVEVHENGLAEKNLIYKRTPTGRPDIDRYEAKLGEHFRLTNLGFTICSYIDHHNE
jgi:hypothetical protein